MLQRRIDHLLTSKKHTQAAKKVNDKILKSHGRGRVIDSVAADFDGGDWIAACSTGASAGI